MFPQKRKGPTSKSIIEAVEWGVEWNCFPQGRVRSPDLLLEHRGRRQLLRRD
jgi:hypothetical protein